MASAALPILFPAVRLGDAFYGDGSVRQTAPLAPAIHLGARAILVVTQRSEPERAASPAPALRDYPTLAEVIGLLLHAIFLDALEADAERIERINRTLARVPAGAAPEGLRPVSLLMLRPSRDLGALAAGSGAKLPPAIRWVVRGMGGHRATAVDFLSYLLFDPAYTTASDRARLRRRAGRVAAHRAVPRGGGGVGGRRAEDDAAFLRAKLQSDARDSPIRSARKMEEGGDAVFPLISYSVIRLRG